VIELARELPAPVPSAAHREEIRTALLAASPAPAARTLRRAWWVPAIGVAAAAAAAVVLIARSAPATVAVHAHGDVKPHSGAHYVALSRSPDEIVRLVDGAIDVEVDPLHPGERFRVIVGDAEVEVHGTAFTVDAAADHLVAVTVAHGRVEVRPRASVPAVLGAGQSWHVPAVRIAAAAPPPAVVVAPPPPRTARVERPQTAPVVAPPPPVEPVEPAVAKSSDEIAYEDGWAAMRAQDYGKAAAAFSRVLLLAPDSALVEDAAYWHAVALARGKRSAEALSAFRDFLDEHAASPRAGEASAMLGWLLVDTHDYDEALRRFRAAAGARDPKVRASAQAGIDALAKRSR